MSTDLQEPDDLPPNVLLKLKISEIDRSVKTRTGVREPTAKEYADIISAGKKKLSEPVVFAIDRKYYLSSGFHRIRAYEILGISEVLCEIREGTLLDAVTFGCFANRTQNAERQTFEDCKAAAVTMLGIDDSLSDGAIADRCNVSDSTVWRIRQDISTSSEKRLRTGLDGKTRKLPEPKVEPEEAAQADKPSAITSATVPDNAVRLPSVEENTDDDHEVDEEIQDVLAATPRITTQPATQATKAPTQSQPVVRNCMEYLGATQVWLSRSEKELWKSHGPLCRAYHKAEKDLGQKGPRIGKLIEDFINAKHGILAEPPKPYLPVDDFF